MESKKFAELTAEVILSKKGKGVKILEIRKISTLTDYFVICSADSDIQVKAISDEIEKQLGDRGIKTAHKEGYESLNWVLLDYFDVIVHIFRHETREFYNLEKFWSDAPVTEVNDN